MRFHDTVSFLNFFSTHYKNNLSINFYRDEEFQGISTDQLRHTEGNVILHITFAINQDQKLGKEFVKHLKVCNTTSIMARIHSTVLRQ